MSFRLADLKKSVRKSKADGYGVTPARLEGRTDAYRIRFALDQLEDHLGRPRRCLDPTVLLDFMGDARLGRGLLAALAQWYRMRPRTFAEALADRPARGAVSSDPGREAELRLRDQGITTPVDLRGRIYTAVNCEAKGFLDPTADADFWQSQSRALEVDRDRLIRLMILDAPEEAILVRSGPRPTAGDVMAAYNARAYTTLLRSAREVTVRAGGSPKALERAVAAWAGGLGVEWRLNGDSVMLRGRADALGCWTRHGRRVERAALELLAAPELDVQEVHGRLEISGKLCGFHWKRELLDSLGVGAGGETWDGQADLIPAFASLLRRERDCVGGGGWSIRKAQHLVCVEGASFLPHLVLRSGDTDLYLRLTGSAEDGAAGLKAFEGKTPVAMIHWPGPDWCVSVQFAGHPPQQVEPGELLAALGDQLRPRAADPALQRLKPAA